MITRLKLKPGQKGTKKLLAEHGEALVCVRYRYDEASRTRIKTAEIIRKYRKDLLPENLCPGRFDTLLSFGSKEGKRVEHVGGFVILDMDHSGPFNVMSDTVVYHKTPCAAKEI